MAVSLVTSVTNQGGAGSAVSVTWPGTIAAGDIAFLLVTAYSTSNYITPSATSFNQRNRATYSQAAEYISTTLLVYDPSSTIGNASNYTGVINNIPTLTGSESGSISVNASPTSGGLTVTLVILRNSSKVWSMLNATQIDFSNTTTPNFNFSNIYTEPGNYVVAALQSTNSAGGTPSLTWSSPSFTGLTFGTGPTEFRSNSSGEVVIGSTVVGGTRGSFSATGTTSSASPALCAVGASFIEHPYLTLSDSGSVTDSNSASKEASRLLTDTISATTDSVTRVTDNGRVLTDTATVAEALAKDSYKTFPTDSVSLTDTPISKTFDWARADSVSTTDSAFTTMYFVRSVSVSDTIVATDTASNYDLKLLESPQSVTDSNQIDLFNTYSPFGNDTITIVEDFYRGIEYVREINETIALTEQLSYIFGGIPVLLSAIGPRTLRADFATIMSDNAFLVAPASYTVSDHSGNIITVLSVSKTPAINPTSVALQLASDLQSGKPYTLTVVPEVQSLAGRSPRPAVATWYKPRGNFQIPISRFGGEIQGGLFGNHGGLVFFSPALTNAIANSVIQVEDVKACTKAFDTYSFPQPIDPPALYTYVKGGENTPVSRVGTGHVWGKWPLLNETKVNFGMPHQTETYVIGGGIPSSFTGTLLTNEGVSGDTSFGTSFTYTEGSSTLVPNGLTIQSVLVTSDSIIAVLKIDFYPIVINDISIATADVASYTSFTGRVISETASFSDSIEVAKNNDLKLVTTSTDALVITESVTSSKSIGIPLTDPITITDQLLRYLDMTRSSNDTFILTEANSVSAERLRTINDTSTLTEQLSFLPKLVSLNYTLADTGGGDTITITGKFLSNATGVTWGGVAGTITGNTATTLTFTTPAKAAGTYSVVVTSNGGTSNSLSLEAWDPSQIPDVMAYFDSRKGVSTSGTDILSWTDQISSTVYSSAVSFRPTLNANTFGTSKPGVQFTAGYQPLTGTRRTFSASKHITSVFCVGKVPDTQTNFGLISDSSSSFLVGISNGSGSLLRPTLVDSTGYHNSDDSGNTKYGGFEGYFQPNSPFLTGWDWYNAGYISTFSGGTIRRYYYTQQNSYTGILQGGFYADSSGSVSRPTNGSAGFDKIGGSWDSGSVGAIVILDTNTETRSSADLAKLRLWAEVCFGI